ncbi:MAG: membrane-associated PAP2 superfamily phosphatase, partial [Zhongshania aliphaticivorans]|uniref:phosphatase PAP2 family protein n=1 Tax=Zhongshania aliphaticivorans TaxID=1470434 RepID=UPI0039E2A77B
GGFALLALYYLPKSRRRRRQMLGIALTAGWAMGGYKMLLGHHFFSHTLVSMLLCWLVTNCITLLVTPTLGLTERGSLRTKASRVKLERLFEKTSQ